MCNPVMLTLCLDTSSPCGLIALAKGGELLGASTMRSAERQGESLLPRIEVLMHEQRVAPRDLDLMGVALGPGGFTAVRVGLATAKGLCLARNTPLVGVESLRVLARGFGDLAQLKVPLRKAYRGEVFAAAYQSVSSPFDSPRNKDTPPPLQELCAPMYGLPSEIVERLAGVVGSREVIASGDGLGIDPIFGKTWTMADEILWDPQPQALVHEVRSVYNTAGASDLATLEPKYVKPSDAKLPARALLTE